MAMQQLKDLYVEQLKDLYSAESQILEALPEMIDRASNNELKSGLRSHLEETKHQRERLDRIFHKLDAKPTGHLCKGMKGLIEEGEEMLKKDGESAVIDAGIIAAAQRVEHYEIAGYGTVRSMAQQLGDNEAANLLGEILEEEKKADEMLTTIAESTVNRYAQAGG